jgi:hypothetical protein
VDEKNRKGLKKILSLSWKKVRPDYLYSINQRLTPIKLPNMPSQLYPYIPRKVRRGSEKGSLPLVVSKILAEFQKTTQSCFSFEISAEGTLLIQDRRAQPNFYFQINKPKKESEDMLLEISYAPSSILEPGMSEDQIKTNDLLAHLDHWKHLCNEYDETNPNTDQQLLSDADQIFEDIKIIDDNSEKVGFSVIEQLVLSECIDKLRTNFHSMHPIIATEEQRREIDAIFVELKIRIHTESKNGFMRRLAGHMARSRRMPVRPGDWLFKAFVTDILLEALKKGFHFNPYKMTYYQTFRIESPTPPAE